MSKQNELAQLADAVTVDGSGNLDVNGTVVADSYALDSIALPSAGTATIFNRNTDNNLYIQTGSGNTVNLLDGSQNTMYAVSPTSHIFQISNAEKMRIDSSGRVTMPNQPSFWATVANDYAGYNPQDYGAGIIFNTALYNIGGHYSTSTGRFTAPVTGTYLLTAECYTTGQVWDQSWFTLNGNRPTGTDHVQNGQAIVGNTSMIKLNANDWVSFHPYSGNTNNLIKAAPNHTWFKGILIG